MSPRAIPAAGGLVLLGSLFLPWYRLADAYVRNENGVHLLGVQGSTAWQALGVTDIVLAILAVVIVVVPRLRRAAAWLAVVLVASRLIELPAYDVGTVAYGGFLALAGALLAAWPGKVRFRTGELIAGLGGLGLTLSLAVHWYSVDWARMPEPRTEEEAEGLRLIFSTSAWTSFAVLDVVLAVLAALMLLVPFTRSVAVAVLASAFGWLAVLLVAVRIAWPPADFVEPSRGAWIALATALVGWIGAWLALRDESTPGAPAPLVPLRPVPNVA